MGIRQQIIYDTPNGHLNLYLTISFFLKQSVSSWEIHKQIGEKAAKPLQERWAEWGSMRTPHSLGPFFWGSYYVRTFKSVLFETC